MADSIYVDSCKMCPLFNAYGYHSRCKREHKYARPTDHEHFRSGWCRAADKNGYDAAKAAGREILDDRVMPNFCPARLAPITIAIRKAP